LKSIAERTAEEHVTVDHEVSIGRPTAEILRAACNHKVELIILSSHKIDPERPTEGWGTISHQVSVLADCPVLLVK
jgi:nucleotide-binding universal stress UspA family protein